MLQKVFRLPANTSFTKARALHTQSITIRYQKNELINSRFGFVVSKRISKSAVVRNRIKRLLRTQIEQNIADIQKGYDMLCIIRKKLPDDQVKEYEDIVNTIKKRVI